jgi:hypothetical protein
MIAGAGSLFLGYGRRSRSLAETSASKDNHRDRGEHREKKEFFSKFFKMSFLSVSLLTLYSLW